MPNPPPAPERFASILRWLIRAVVAQTLGGPLGLRIIGLIVSRLTPALQRFEALAARIAAGTYRPRRPITRPRHTTDGQSPPPPSEHPLCQDFGWLLPLVPHAGARRAELEALLSDPEMAALLAAAPAPMRRIVGPLCWMLGLRPPPALARPRARARPQSADPPPDPTPPARASALKPPPRRLPRTPLAAYLVPAPPPPSLTLEYGFGPPRLVWT